MSVGGHQGFERPQAERQSIAAPAGAAAIVLAAGRARRYGRDKRLEPVGAMPMFLHAALRLQRIADTLVVLGPEDGQQARLLAEHGVDFVHCPQAAQGMGHSLACGVAQRREAAGWFVMPADMPFIRAATLEALARAAARHELAAPAYQGRRGHPVWFARRYLPQLLALAGDQGARAILEAGEPFLLPVDDPGCVLDVDRPEDLEQMLR
jgi:molybdenum cofactor cytidylyltransferase